MVQRAISKAEELERKGLWRRAARQWLDVMGYSLKDQQFDDARKRRIFCLSQLKAREKPKELGIPENAAC